MRVFVLSLDGVPLSFLKKNLDKFTNLAKIFESGSLVELHSVLPTVSCVAWSTYLTGVNPGAHGIFGFIERSGYNLYINNGANLQVKPFIFNLSQLGKKVVSINVPMTYPPSPVNGILVSGFLAPNRDKAVEPQSFLSVLKKFNYKVDVDVTKPHKGDWSGFLRECFDGISARFSVAEYILSKYDWDYFHLHIMETDRINHFLLGKQEFLSEFYNFYTRLDENIGRLFTKLKNTEFLMLSDHGFCELKYEVDLNYFLEEKGYLSYKMDLHEKLHDISPKSKAYSLIPGRIYMLDESVKNNLINDLEALEINEAKVIEKIYSKDEVYHGKAMELAPDFVLKPVNGFDLKASFSRKNELTRIGVISGMHTFDDAFFFIKGYEVKKSPVHLSDLLPTIYKLMGIELTLETDGVPLV